MKKIYEITGMHCRSCEVLIEDKIKNIEGVRKVFASQKKGQATVYGEDFKDSDVAAAIKEAGYSVGKKNLPLINNSKGYFKDLAIVLTVFFSLYLFGRLLGFQDLFSVGSTATSNLIVVFTIGLTAGLSTCMALIGGLVLGISARFAEKHPDSTPIQKFRPHLFFNLGRIASYFLFGGVIGQLGSVFRISNGLFGTITIIIGVVMLFLGVQLLEIFPRFSTGFTLPKFITRFLKIKDRHEKEYSHKNSLLLGAMTFFLPCGFTQAMQVYAVTTGSFVRGALIMGVFAIGTAPGLLGIGGLTSAFKEGRFKQLFFKFVGLVVIALAFFNISTGFNLSGVNLSFLKNEEKQEEEEWTVISGPKTDTNSNTEPGPVNPDLQIIKATYDTQNIIAPKQFTVKVGKPVRFEIYAKENGEGCMGSVMIPGLADEPQFFVQDQTVTYEFTPRRTGKFRITCAMGLQAGTIIVK